MSKDTFGGYSAITIDEQKEFLRRRLHEFEGQHYALTINREELLVELSLLDDDERAEKGNSLLDDLNDQVAATEGKIKRLRNILESLG